MKKLLFLGLAALLYLIPAEAYSQEAGVQISGYTGWFLGGKVNLYNGKIKIDDGQNWGATLSKEVYSGLHAEFMYNRLVSDLIVREYGSSPYTYTSITTQYFQIGAVREAMYEGAIRPFFTGGLGITVFSEREMYYDDLLRMSFSMGGGLKIFPTDRVGFRLQARMLVPMYFNGIWVGIGTGGTSTGLSASSSIVQGDFTGGIILAF